MKKEEVKICQLTKEERKRVFLEEKKNWE